MSIEALKDMHHVVATNLELTPKERDTKVCIPDKRLREDDSVLFKDHTADVWKSKYTCNYRTAFYLGKTQVKVAD